MKNFIVIFFILYSFSVFSQEKIYNGDGIISSDFIMSYSNENNEYEKFLQINPHSRFLPDHGDIFYYGLAVEKQDIIDKINKICGIEAYLFFDERLDNTIIIFYIEEHLDKEFYCNLLQIFIFNKYEKYFQ